MYKKIIALALSATLLSSAFCFSAAADTAVDNHAPASSQKEVNYPEINLLQNRTDGLKIGWTKYPNAKAYRVFKYDGKKWRIIGVSDHLSYIYKDVRHGESNLYTVRAMDENNNFISGYNAQGYNHTYSLVPEIKGLSNTSTGIEVSWNKCKNVDKYRVYVLDGSWKSVGTSTSDKLVIDKLKDGKTYTLTLRGLKKDGSFASAYKKDGWKQTFITPTVLNSAENAASGVSLKWKTKASVEKYRIYRKAGNGSWARLADVTGGAYTDKNVSSGTSYSYKLRGINAAATRFTTYYTNTKTAAYVKAPSVSSFENGNGSVKLSWSGSKGAAKYGVFYKDGGTWRGLGITASTSYTDKNVKNLQTKLYTVRCLDKNSNFISGFNSNGFSNTYYAPPSIASVSKASSGNNVSWKSVSGITSYRLYRRTVNEGWSRLCDTSTTSYNDSSAKNGSVYTYTLRLFKDGKCVSSYINDTLYYYNGSPADGKININGTSYTFSKGKIHQGFVTINGGKYYYNNQGLLEKNGIVGNSKDGYYYADKNGKVDTSYRGAVTSGGSDWIVFSGKATKVTTEANRTMFRAMKLAAKITNSSMTKAQKLRACYNHIRDGYVEYNTRVPDYTGMDWPVVYANDIFIRKGGDCLSCAAAFGYLAKAIGYDNVYGCHSGGHGWTEVDGKIYDTEWERHTPGSFFGRGYGECTNPAYAAAISPGYPWMHVKIQ
ncbi:MAG TPA: hypothetical protein DEO32_06490 [Ruminococcaceae bacterium]|nr:hypothetical protein [Oscillospiraceae bacterium]